MAFLLLVDMIYNHKLTQSKLSTCFRNNFFTSSHRLRRADTLNIYDKSLYRTINSSLDRQDSTFKLCGNERTQGVRDGRRPSNGSSSFNYTRNVNDLPISVLLRWKHLIYKI
jgi:hypothetical protein